MLRYLQAVPRPAGHLQQLTATRLASGLTSVIESEAGFTRLQGFTSDGFIVNNVQVEGSILCYSDIWLLWKASSVSKLTPSALSFVDVVKPSPDVVILGTGGRLQQPPSTVTEYLKSRGIALEVLDTRNAIAYFNFLNEEGRLVVGAMLPPGTPDSDHE